MTPLEEYVDATKAQLNKWLETHSNSGLIIILTESKNNDTVSSMVSFNLVPILVPVILNTQLKAAAQELIENGSIKLINPTDNEGVYEILARDAHKA